MTAATTLTPAAFLLARLADDEAAALDAAGGRSGTWEAWSGASAGGGEYLTADSDYTFGVSPGISGDAGWHIARRHTKHIARHDPARELAQVAALRAVVERCRPRFVVMYRESERLLAEAFDQENVQTVAHSGPVYPFEGAEDILLALVQPFADHPDFAPAWLAS